METKIPAVVAVDPSEDAGHLALAKQHGQRVDHGATQQVLSIATPSEAIACITRPVFHATLVPAATETIYIVKFD